MKVCPYCNSSLNWKTVKSVRPDGSKWYEYSNQPFLRRTCSFCDNELVQDFAKKWYYILAGIIWMPLLVMAIVIGKELPSSILYLVIIVCVISSAVQHLQFLDYKYITLDEAKEKKVKSLMEYAQGHLENPIDAEKYCLKYQLTRKELNQMISKGYVDAYAINGVDYLNDEPIDKKPNK